MINRDKAETIIEANSSRNESASKTIQKLIGIMINEARVDNDTAQVRRVFRNQGKIAALTQLQEYIDRGQPSTAKNT